VRGGPNRHNIHSLGVRILRRISTLASEQLIQSSDARPNTDHLAKLTRIIPFEGYTLKTTQ
jgi:hypothetical protein